MSCPLRVPTLLRLAGVLLACLLSGCSHREQWDETFNVRPAAEGKLEVELVSHVSGCCNVHTFLPYKWDNRFWLYLPRNGGRIPAADLILTRSWRCFDHATRMVARGFVEVSPDTLVMRLEADRRDPGATHYFKFGDDGVHKLRAADAQRYDPQPNDASLTCQKPLAAAPE